MEWGIHAQPPPSTTWACTTCPRGSGCTTPLSHHTRVQQLYQTEKECRRRAVAGFTFGDKGCTYNYKVNNMNKIGWLASLALKYNATHPNVRRAATLNKQRALAEGRAAGLCCNCLKRVIGIDNVTADVWRTVEAGLTATCGDHASAGARARCRAPTAPTFSYFFLPLCGRQGPLRLRLQLRRLRRRHGHGHRLPRCPATQVQSWPSRGGGAARLERHTRFGAFSRVHVCSSFVAQT